MDLLATATWINISSCNSCDFAGGFAQPIIDNIAGSASGAATGGPNNAVLSLSPTNTNFVYKLDQPATAPYQYTLCNASGQGGQTSQSATINDR